ncbi:alpha/beta hydrolase [Gleimia sp. 6138-11-ORH1]|uniref:alpha/beta fold hydrolase n=1 Tax=Gleimia sp. 6138-11-ORH1 TaxID=2973937 RepID=UPI00216825FB|nr:alpha/beta hydrolase [Gleimia sp. 6138-11-ORH1]MCS4484368.1 alpha/beta hydrolase [Gleimia sp. 6138-11-ORH1]
MNTLRTGVFSTDLGVVHYQVSKVSSTDAPWLVFLPGLTADSTLFKYQLEAFLGRANLLVWDAPAHGKSRPFPLSFSLADLATWLQQIFLSEGVTEPVLIGQSMGGYLSQVFMQKFPGVARAFVSIDSVPILRSFYSDKDLWLLKHSSSFLSPMPWSMLQAATVRGSATTPLGRENMSLIVKQYAAREYVQLAAFGYRIIAEAIEQASSEGLSVPALLICGTKDRAGEIRKLNQRWSLMSELPIVWVKGAGHNSNVDDPDTVNQAITKFLTSLKGFSFFKETVIGKE